MYSFFHGWRCQPDRVRQRADSGRLLRHLDRLFGIPKGRYYLYRRSHGGDVYARWPTLADADRNSC